MNNLNELENIGTHKFLDVLLNSFRSGFLIGFIVLFFITFFISKKISKKAFNRNNLIYGLLFFIYLIISLIKAYTLSNLPPHDLSKDLCGLRYDAIKVTSIFHIPLIYTLIILAKYGDKRIKDKKQNKKEEIKNEL